MQVQPAELKMAKKHQNLILVKKKGDGKNLSSAGCTQHLKKNI